MHTSRNLVASHYESPSSALILQLDFNLVKHTSSLPIMLIFKRPTPPENVYWFDKNFSNVSKTNVRNFDPGGGKFDIVQAAILNVVKVLYEINILEQHFLVATVQTTKSESVMSVNRKKSWMHQLNLEAIAAENDVGKKSGLLPDGNKIGILSSVFSDIVFANLVTLCSDKFPSRNLAAAFWNFMNCIEANVEVGYPGLVDAVVLLGISCAFEHAIRCDSAYNTIVINDVQKGKLVLFVNSMSLSGNLVGFSKVDMKASLEFLNVQDLFMDGTLFSLTQGFEMAAEKSHVHPWANFVAFCLLGKSVVACSFSIHWVAKNAELRAFYCLNLTRSSSEVEKNITCLDAKVCNLVWTMGCHEDALYLEYSSEEPSFTDTIYFALADYIRLTKGTQLMLKKVQVLSITWTQIIKVCQLQEEKCCPKSVFMNAHKNPELSWKVQI